MFSSARGRLFRTLLPLLEELRGYPSPESPAPAAGNAHGNIFVPFQLRTDQGLLSFFSTTTVFGTAVDTYVDPHRKATGLGMPRAPLYLGGTDFIRVGPEGLSSASVGFVDATPAM